MRLYGSHRVLGLMLVRDGDDLHVVFGILVFHLRITFDMSPRHA